MFSDEPNAGETAVAFADLFVDAAVRALDGRFGDGYTKANPPALAAYLATCASNLNAFMMAASAMEEESAFDEAIAAFEETIETHAPKPKGRHR